MRSADGKLPSWEGLGVGDGRKDASHDDTHPLPLPGGELRRRCVTSVDNIMNLQLTVNGKKRQLEVDDSMRLLDILREKLDLTGTKEGCGIGECGACTVIMNGEAVCSCLVLAAQAQGANIETVESLEQNDTLSDLQAAFLRHGAVQCGFCTPGMLMSAKALLDRNPHPTEQEIRKALEGNLCRCTGYIPIVEAVNDVSQENARSSR
ncbi:carbon monoxide dehydrogenase, small subunit [Candidatus Moduliflexus flocculans]|uniref:Carbon monoxide dehydrogenase, small subunit n=1 Tax=Candidatus Moduliflexus flocculans TaxID=1499966 RepID=A0A081BTG1_9BACT|nr:carbon monoxide dehydrogenase, small subunit [Candidatus Moduliflexus flocculans]